MYNNSICLLDEFLICSRPTLLFCLGELPCRVLTQFFSLFICNFVLSTADIDAERKAINRLVELMCDDGVRKIAEIASNAARDKNAIEMSRLQLQLRQLRSRTLTSQVSVGERFGGDVSETLNEKQRKHE